MAQCGGHLPHTNDSLKSSSTPTHLLSLFAKEEERRTSEREKREREGRKRDVVAWWPSPFLTTAAYREVQRVTESIYLIKGTAANRKRERAKGAGYSITR